MSPCFRAQLCARSSAHALNPPTPPPPPPPCNSNEQENPDFVSQVAAIEARRAAVGAPELFYMYPTNGGVSAAVAAQLTAIPLSARHVAPDCHVGGGGGVSCALDDFNRLPDFQQSAINCETNAAISDMNRAIMEAADLQAWFNVSAALQERLLARTASFCGERSGHFDAFDQGISFFLPNSAWPPPPLFFPCAAQAPPQPLPSPSHPPAPPCPAQ